MGPGCGVPDFVDPKIYGDNNLSQGTLRIQQLKSGLQFDFRLFNLSRPNHVITAWLLWKDPLSTDRGGVFQVADIVSPCAPYTAAFTSGFGREPNEFVYTSKTEARLNIKLNFNPTFPGEGALTRKVPCFQKDVPGIQGTLYKQFPVPGAGDDVFVPTSSDYLRSYDPKTGFEKLDARRIPNVVRSPDKALVVEVINHLDNTTHGISPGAFMVDHYSLLIFSLQGVQIGASTV